MKKYTPLTAILQKVSNNIASQGMDAPIKGSGRLTVGWHSVVITSVDTTRLDDQGRFSVVLDSGVQTHNHSVFVLDMAKTDLGWQFRMLVKGLFNDDIQCKEFIDIMLADNNEALQALRGMKLDVEIQPGPGYVIDSGQGGYIAKNAQTGEVVTEALPSIQATRKSAESTGLKRSYTRVSNVESTFSEENFKALQNAREAIISAEKTNSTSISDLVTD